MRYATQKGKAIARVALRKTGPSMGTMSNNEVRGARKIFEESRQATRCEDEDEEQGLGQGMRRGARTRMRMRREGKEKRVNSAPARRRARERRDEERGNAPAWQAIMAHASMT